MQSSLDQSTRRRVSLTLTWRGRELIVVRFLFMCVSIS